MPEIPEITSTDVLNASQFLTTYLGEHLDDPRHSGLIWSITVLKVAAVNWLTLVNQVEAMIAAGQLTCNPAPVIQPTDQIRNVLNALLTLVDGPPHKHRWSAIRSTVHQLGDMLAAHFRGELAPLPVDPDVPF